MYTLINGNQGPHTVPFIIIDTFCQICSYDELRSRVLTPRQFREWMDAEGIFDYETSQDNFINYLINMVVPLVEEKDQEPLTQLTVTANQSNNPS